MLHFLDVAGLCFVRVTSFAPSTLTHMQCNATWTDSTQLTRHAFGEPACNDTKGPTCNIGYRSAPLLGTVAIKTRHVQRGQSPQRRRHSAMPVYMAKGPATGVRYPSLAHDDPLLFFIYFYLPFYLLSAYYAFMTHLPPTYSWVENWAEIYPKQTIVQTAKRASKSSNVLFTDPIYPSTFEAVDTSIP
jgi:hypothetical protein